jgi:hypothetical protein
MESKTMLLVDKDELKAIIKELFVEAICENAQKDNANKSEEQELLTSDETAKMLHKNRTSLWRWAKSGYLVPVSVGGSKMYRKSDITKLMEG